MRRLVTAALAALLLAACGSAPPAPSATEREAVGQNQRAARALRSGRLDEARTLYEAALRADRSVENADGIATNLLALARVEQSAGNVAAAEAHLDAVLNAAPLALPQGRKAEAAARRALIALDGADAARATDWAKRADALCTAAACSTHAAIITIGARAALAAGDAASALALGRRALDTTGGTAAGAYADDPRSERANAQRIIGEAALALRDATGAAQALTEALKLDQVLGRADRVWLDLMLLAGGADLAGNREAARAYYRRALDVATAARDDARAQAARARLN